MLHATKISVRKGGQACLEDVSFSIMGGELTVIVGASGSGKTTLLEVCAGLVIPDRGDVWVAGHKDSLWRSSAPGARRAYLTSDETWQMAVPAVDVVAMGCQDAGVALGERRRRARLAMTCTQADGWLRRSMSSLSTTQQLRVRLARLLVQMWNVQPDGLSYVLIDALHGAACQVTQQLVFDVAQSLAKRGAAVAMVTHDYTRVLDEADRVVMLRDGEIVADGSPQAMLTPGRLAVVLNVDAAVERSEQTGRCVVSPRPTVEPLALPF